MPIIQLRGLPIIFMSVVPTLLRHWLYNLVARNNTHPRQHVFLAGIGASCSDIVWAWIQLIDWVGGLNESEVWHLKLEFSTVMVWMVMEMAITFAWQSYQRSK